MNIRDQILREVEIDEQKKCKNKKKKYSVNTDFGCKYCGQRFESEEKKNKHERMCE